MKIKCCICGREFIGYGHNPDPVKKEGRCCSDCNVNVVIPERIKLFNNLKSNCREYKNLGEYTCRTNSVNCPFNVNGSCGSNISCNNKVEQPATAVQIQRNLKDATLTLTEVIHIINNCDTFYLTPKNSVTDTYSKGVTDFKELLIKEIIKYCEG